LRPAAGPRRRSASAVAQWIETARERLDVMIDSSSSSVIDIRDTCLFLSSCLRGALQMAGVPIDKVNQATHDFQEALDAHLLDRLPEHTGFVWNTNVLN
jgi:hypothetical protein